MKKTIPLILLSFVIMLSSSCHIKLGYVTFENTKPDEIIATPAIKKFLKEHPNPAIVLRVPTPSHSATDADANAESQNGAIYNSIEKELALAGFNVKDRGLFEQIMEKANKATNGANIDYAQITELTGADLILDLTRIERSHEYVSNKFYNRSDELFVKKNQSKTVKGGATIEFKITIIRNNEYGGSYAFSYAPCVEKSNDCACQIYYKSHRFYPDLEPCKKKNEKTQGKTGYSGYVMIPEDKLEAFVRGGIKKVIREIRGE